MTYVEGNSGSSAPGASESPSMGDAGLAAGIIGGAVSAEVFIPEGSYLRYFVGAALVLGMAKLVYDLDRAGDLQRHE